MKQSITDKEIKQALVDYNCNGNRGIAYTYKGLISISDVIDLIDRMEAEIEVLRDEVRFLDEYNNKLLKKNCDLKEEIDKITKEKML